MGCCLSKKGYCSPPPSICNVGPVNPQEMPKSEVERQQQDGGAPGRRTKEEEEVDVILIECGRLSRSNSSGSTRKRSYDLDNDSTSRNTGDSQRYSRSQRRTPSRERDKDRAARPRSGSRGRKVSRSPGRRRSESPPITNKNIHGPDSNSTSSAADKPSSRPGKMVVVPATVSSLAADSGEDKPSKTVQLNKNQPASLTRSNSSKVEHSPYTRNPLAEIDSNIIQKQHQNAEETKGLNVISSGKENLKPRKVAARSGSSRLSWDLEVNAEVLINHNESSPYTALLLEDIQNFHQTKHHNPHACSILEAVAGLNCSTVSNIFCEDAPQNLIIEQMSKFDNKPTSGKTKTDPILESEVIANKDDLMQPSFHKCVTAGTDCGVGEDLEEQESSGSNSVPCSQQHWVPSCWEPNSADSIDHSMSSSSSRLVCRQNGVKPVSSQKHAISESGKGRRRMSTKKRDTEKQTGIGRGRTRTQGPQMAAAAVAT